VAATLADFYISASTRSSGAAAELAATRKITKFCNLHAAYMFQPIALETLGAINSSAGEFLLTWVERSAVFLARQERGFFFSQRLSIVLQRYNAILLHESFYEGDEPNR